MSLEGTGDWKRVEILRFVRQRRNSEHIVNCLYIGSNEDSLVVSLEYLDLLVRLFSNTFLYVAISNSMLGDTPQGLVQRLPISHLNRPRIL